MTKPEAAPFFLPTTAARGDAVFDLDGDGGDGGGGGDEENDDDAAGGDLARTIVRGSSPRALLWAGTSRARCSA